MMKLALSILLFPSALFGDAFTVGPLPAKDLSTKVLMAVPKEGKDIDEVTVSGEEVSQDLFTIGLGDHGVVTVALVWAAGCPNDSMTSMSEDEAIRLATPCPE